MRLGGTPLARRSLAQAARPTEKLVGRAKPPAELKQDKDIVMTQSESLPHRRKLPHRIPSWVRQGAWHFVTVNCQERGTDGLCRDDVLARLLKSARHYEEIGRWYLWLMVVMPDHVHLIVTFDLERGVRLIMKAWKSYLTRNLSIQWQSDFFEHRLRNDEEFVQKMHYVRMNPVRKGLVSSPDAWPYVIDRISLPEELGTGAMSRRPQVLG